MEEETSLIFVIFFITWAFYIFIPSMSFYALCIAKCIIF